MRRQNGHWKSVKTTTVTVPRAASASSSRMAGGTPPPQDDDARSARSATPNTALDTLVSRWCKTPRALLGEITSRAYDTCADQVGEPLALLFLEERVDAREGERDRFSQALCALHAQLAAFARSRLAELGAFERVGERCDGAPVVDLGLGALGLEVVEDARKHRGLRLGELELVREEAQRASHAKEAAVVGRPAAEPSAAAGCMTAVTVTGSVAVAGSVAERRAVVTTASGATKPPSEGL